MNLFKFLKSASGKVVLGTTQILGTSAAVGILATYTMFNVASKQVDNEIAVRSLSGISSESAYSGLRQKGDLLTSINVKDGLNQVATAEERAAIEAGSGSSNNFGLDSVSNVQNISVGRAAGTSETEGLGMGGNKVVMSGPIGSTGAAGAAGPGGVNPGAVSGAAGAGAPAGGPAAGTASPSLGTASMARASGNAFNAAAGSVGGQGASGATRASGGSSGSSGSDGYKFSGSMPTGSNAVSAMGLNAADRGSSGFMAGGRRSSGGPGARSFGEKSDLKDISKRSADAAGNRNRSANEGSRAFLASSVNSGGMSVEGGVETDSAGSADFKAPEAAKLKGVGKVMEEKDDFAERQQKARKKLLTLMLSLIAATVVAIPLAFFLIGKGRKLMSTGVGAAAGAALMAAGFAVVAAIAALSATVIWKAVDYQKNFNGNLLPIISYVVAAGALGVMTYTVIKAMTADISGDKVAMMKIGKLCITAGKKFGMTTAFGMGKTAVTHAMQNDGANTTDPNKKK